MISVSSTAFADNARIPKQHTGEGKDVSPPLAWSNLPAGAKELALICDDPDAPTPKPWVHWVLYKLPPTLSGLKEGDSGGGVNGLTDFGTTGYGGPMPPQGHGVHRYYFTVYALKDPLKAGPRMTKDQLLAAMKGLILDQGRLLGTYERK